MATTTSLSPHLWRLFYLCWTSLLYTLSETFSFKFSELFYYKNTWPDTCLGNAILCWTNSTKQLEHYLYYWIGFVANDPAEPKRPAVTNEVDLKIIADYEQKVATQKESNRFFFSPTTHLMAAIQKKLDHFTNKIGIGEKCLGLDNVVLSGTYDSSRVRIPAIPIPMPITSMHLFRWLSQANGVRYYKSAHKYYETGPWRS